MARQQNKLVWGLTFLACGGLWLLSQAHVLSRGRLADLLGTTVLFGIAGLFHAGYRSDPGRHYLKLVPAGLFAAIGIMVFLDEALRLRADALWPLALFAGLAAAFGRIYSLDQRRSWAMLLAVGAVILGLTAFLGNWRFFRGDLAPMVFLAGTGALFVWHFLRTGKEWALIPGGILITTSVLPLIDRIPVVEDLAAAFTCFGFAATFGAVFVLGRPGSSSWARYPAVAFAAFGCLALFVGIAQSVLVYALPVALIGAGIYLIRNSLGAGTNGSSGPALTPPAP